MTASKPNRRSTWWYIRQMLGSRYRGRVIVSVVVMLLAVVFETFGIAAILPVLIYSTGADGASAGGFAAKLHDFFGYFGGQPTLGVLLIFVVAGIGMKALVGLAGTQLTAKGSVELTADLRSDFMRAIMASSWNYVISQPAGAIANAVSYDANRAAGMFAGTVNLIVAVLSSIPFAVMAFFMSWQLTIGSIAVSALIMLVLRRHITATRRNAIELSTVANSLLALLVDTLGSMKPLKSMDLQDRLWPVLQSSSDRLALAERKQSYRKSVQGLSQEPILAAIVAVGLYVSVTHLSLGIAELSFMLVLFHRLVTRLLAIQGQLQVIAAAEAAYLHVSTLTAQAQACAEFPQGVDATPDSRSYLHLTRSIEFKDVSLTYGDRWVFQDLNLVLPAGKMIAVVGPSGAGKTTLVDMITTLQQPQVGAVLVDGLPLTRADIPIWRHRIGYVPQELQLLNDTIYNNLTLLDPALTHADAQRALEMADAWKFVSGLPEGLDTPVGERGAALSGGQRQRIAIARALIRSPDLLILDEATTALDPLTEREICNTLKKLVDPLTILAISHQPAIAAISEVIVRVEDGRAVVEERRSRRDQPASVEQPA